MDTVAEGKPQVQRRRGVYRYLIPHNRIGMVARQIDSDFRIITTKRLHGFQLEDELSLNAFEKIFGDEVLVAPSSQTPANSNAVTDDEKAYEPDARARTILRGVDVAKADLAAAGGAYKLSEVRQILHGISRQRVERRVQEGSLLAVPGPSNRRVYPTIQFNRDGTVVDGLSEVQRALGYKNPWSVLNFLINESDGLDGKRPIDALRNGEIDRVVRIARAAGVQGS